MIDSLTMVFKNKISCPFFCRLLGYFENPAMLCKHYHGYCSGVQCSGAIPVYFNIQA